MDVLFTHSLFRTHVLRGPKTQAGLCHASAPGTLHGERDTKIRNEGVSSLKEDILGLYVAVNDAEFMRAAKSIRDFTSNKKCIVDGQLTLALEAGAQRLARDVRHDVVQKPASITTIEQRQNVGMLQPRCGLDLSQESFASERGSELLMQNLDRHVAIVPQVTRKIHRGHSAGAELALDAIAVWHRSGEPGGHIVKGRCHCSRQISMRGPDSQGAL
jgi:hypothetical protein